jgi:hypothetical protein
MRCSVVVIFGGNIGRFGRVSKGQGRWREVGYLTNCPNFIEEAKNFRFFKYPRDS